MKTPSWTVEEQKLLRMKVFQQGVDKGNLRDNDWPNDVHLIEYSINGRLYCDAVRAQKKVFVFNHYYDKLLSYRLNDGTAFEIHSITNGYGRISPKLYQD